MAYYPDLSPYAYLPGTLPPDVTARNVGWLSGWRRFPKGSVPAGFTEALGLLIRDRPSALTRGMHPCGLRHRLGEPRQPLHAEVEGRPVPLGTAEVRVVSPHTGHWLIAPTLVHHYVIRHRYLPPPDFVEAVLAEGGRGV